MSHQEEPHARQWSASLGHHGGLGRRSQCADVGAHRVRSAYTTTPRYPTSSSTPSSLYSTETHRAGAFARVAPLRFIVLLGAERDDDAAAALDDEAARGMPDTVGDHGGGGLARAGFRRKRGSVVCATTTHHAPALVLP